MNKHPLLFLNVVLFFFAIFLHAAENTYFNTYANYNSDNLICGIFNIAGNCFITDKVKATKGTVCGTMTGNEINIKKTLDVYGNLTAKQIFITETLHVYGNFNTVFLHAASWDVQGAMHAEKVEGLKGKVSGSMNVDNIICKQSLNVGESLETKCLKCATVNVGGNLNTGEMYVNSCIVGGSISIAQKGSFDQMTVHGSLFCNNIKSKEKIEVGGTIKAKDSTFNEIFILSKKGKIFSDNNTVIGTNNSTVTYHSLSAGNNTVIATNNSTVTYHSLSSSFYSIGLYFYNKYIYLFWSKPTIHTVFEDQTFTEDQTLAFENCIIDSINIGNNNKNNIIELDYTIVNGNISFPVGTVGKVYLKNSSHVLGDVINGQKIVD